MEKPESKAMQTFKFGLFGAVQVGKYPVQLLKIICLINQLVFSLLMKSNKN
jgi:hypothetical protein